MANNLGKAFEARFKSDWEKSFPKGFLLRLPDQQSGYFGTSRNICDFIAFLKGNLFLLECKSKKGNTFPLINLKQYDKLTTKQNIEGITVGIIVWFIEHDKILFIPISTFDKLIEDNKKSFNIKMLGDERYKSIEIPSVKKRTFMESDYTVLLNKEDN